MGEVPPGHDAVRAYLDSAVAEAAERWVGRAADATAYADLVGAVLARREALSPMSQFSEPHGAAPLLVEAVRPRHFERRARARWPLTGDAARPPHTPVVPVQQAPFSAPLELRPGADLPSRPPGRHRLPPPVDLGPRAIDLDQNLNTVLDWLGRPES